MGGLRLYMRYAGVSIRGQMQYPASFLMLVTGQLLITGIEFVGILALFDRFRGLQGWTLPEVALFYATVNLAWGLAEMIGRGFDMFGPNFVKTGDFDRLLLRPRSPVLQLLGYELRLTRVGRLAQAAVVLAIAVSMLPVVWGLQEVLLLAAAILGGAALFIGLLVLQATLAFWTVESLEIANTLTYGGVQAAQYPIAIYSAWLRRFFTFVVPLACVAYFPLVAILGVADPMGAPRWLQVASPLAGPLFLAASLLVWRLGVRRYTSAGG